MTRLLARVRVTRLMVSRAWAWAVLWFCAGCLLHALLPEAWEPEYLGGVCIGVAIALGWRAIELMDRKSNSYVEWRVVRCDGVEIPSLWRPNRSEFSARRVLEERRKNRELDPFTAQCRVIEQHPWKDAELSDPFEIPDPPAA